MTAYCHIDFETRSACDLTAAGTWRYAEDPSTEVLCVSFDGGAGIHRWRPGDDDSGLRDLASNPVVIFVAHNAMFEQAIWAGVMVARHGFSPIPVHRWTCTMAASAWKGLPLALARVAATLGLSEEKDKEGRDLMLRLCKPAGKRGLYKTRNETWDPAKPGFVDPRPFLPRLQRYCDQDVQTEKAIEKTLGHLSKAEREVWLMDQRINQRGIRIDLPFVRAAQEVIAGATGPLEREFAALTGGLAISQIEKVTAWANERGANLTDLRAATIEELLGRRVDFDDEAGYDSLADDESESHTTRIILRRAAVVAEAPVEVPDLVTALAGQHDKCDLLATGQDVYLDMAHEIYGLPPGALTKENVKERTIGKNTVLGCGFGMGWRKFRERYCPDQPEEFAQRVIDAYRTQWAPMVRRLWYALDEAAMRAVENPGTPFEAYGVTYLKPNSQDWLTARLPSGWQTLWYPKPRVIWDDIFDRKCWTYSAMKMGQWIRPKAYGGLLAENVVQALARGLLCTALKRLERAGMPVVLTVHDEIVCEVDSATADLDAFEDLMSRPTDWSEKMKLPIAVEAWQGDRYRK